MGMQPAQGPDREADPAPDAASLVQGLARGGGGGQSPVGAPGQGGQGAGERSQRNRKNDSAVLK